MIFNIPFFLSVKLYKWYFEKHSRTLFMLVSVDTNSDLPLTLPGQSTRHADRIHAQLLGLPDTLCADIWVDWHLLFMVMSTGMDERRQFIVLCSSDISSQ